MRWRGDRQRNATGNSDVPFVVRLLGKVVLEVLPAALASVIGAFLFAHYQFERSAGAPAAAAPATVAAPASTKMLALVRDEHAMLRDYLIEQRAAEESRAAADDAADARAAATAKTAAAAVRRPAALAVRRSAPPKKPVNVASAPKAAAALPPVVVAGLVPEVAAMPPAPPPSALPVAIGPAQRSLVDRTLALPRHVVTVTLHAVMVIGGIPSWIGQRLGAADLDSGERQSGTAS